ncbi:MAG: Holliday junction resolvase RuvX [Flavobacteriales bacterium]|mgnify:FL=1|jgi:putative Holliday junction resolvase|nr:Holliday junction resolvase RuvX [Flavobacteriales bacterium]MBT3963806.1 Holliday junction resolvase RuvX [Flavobacteriales bacterium]MBT4705413.1 Holliday junction resolvase RuvX [Flavobacteriales bacterium]MBT4929836.1 Holliday junction resolvase RuvX [Flavobacteriales bacterium]MBT5132210.1 Holliday junction resolvase RuvX [Flavobacteriales bacterium]
MGRILSIDFGMKRSGLALSDPLKMIANGLDTVDSRELLDKVLELASSQDVETVVIGHPKRMSGEDSAIENNIQIFIQELRKKTDTLNVDRMDERFTSKLALDSMIRAGSTKKQRSDKGLIDKVSATLILQEYLNQDR